jgi:drug/metabolite transporter (DMT)-like permease
MVYWLLITILAYLFFSFASLGDKLVLAGKPKPNSYTFYVGVFGIFVILFIPFIKNFSFPDSISLTWIILDSIVRIIGMYAMYVALERFDVSKVIATIGATQPIFIFILTWIFFGPQSMPLVYILAFFILLSGSIIISINKDLKITRDYLKITIFSSFMFSLDYIFAKLVFLNGLFLQDVVWTGIFIFLFAFIFLLSKKSRKEVLSKKMVLNQKTEKSFLLAQFSGGLAIFLRSYAIYLAPVTFLAIINSLVGVQYIFLFIITLFISFFFPKILKEELSNKIIFQKIISIILIGIGLGILVVY